MSDLLSYISTLVLTGIAIIGLIKEWREYAKWARWSLVFPHLPKRGETRGLALPIGGERGLGAYNS